MIAQRAELAEEDARALVEGAPGVGQGDAIAAAVQQGEAELCLQVLHGGEDGRMGAMQLRGRSLEAALADDSVEAQKLMDRGVDHCRNIL
jgi:hypothetical protein